MSQDINAALSKPELTAPSLAPIRPSTAVASQSSSSTWSQQIPVSSHPIVKFEPHSAPFPHPPPQFKIEKSAKALKNELQQRVR